MIQRLSLDFLKDNGVCDEAYEWTKNTFQLDFEYSPYIDWDYGRNVLLEYIEANPQSTTGWLEWFDKLKKSKEYVYYNGEQVTMLEKYQVFNPITGMYTTYETESEMRQSIVDVVKQTLETMQPRVAKEIQNENGDSAWVPLNLLDIVQITSEDQ
jgi:hypothetical protein